MLEDVSTGVTAAAHTHILHIELHVIYPALYMVRSVAAVVAEKIV